MKPSPNTHAAVKKEGVVLLDSKRGVVFALNPIGAMIWERIEKSDSREDLAKMLKTKFPGVPSEQIIGDLDSFLNALTGKHLIDV